MTPLVEQLSFRTWSLLVNAAYKRFPTEVYTHRESPQTEGTVRMFLDLPDAHLLFARQRRVGFRTYQELAETLEENSIASWPTWHKIPHPKR